MASVIVIGVGSTGLAVLERAEQFYYEFTRQNCPTDRIGLLFLETDSGRQASVTSNGTTMIQNCQIELNNVSSNLKDWHDHPREEWNWMPENADVLNAGIGAGGQPAMGRVALWSNANLVSEQIERLFRSVGGNAETKIYIVGSLTGGTGTGMFIDIAYMVRKNRGNNIYGMFMLPNALEVGDVSKRPLYENAYSSLRSLDKFSKIADGEDTNYICNLPTGTDLSSLQAPFYNVQFYSHDFNNGAASLGSLTDLEKTVGFNLAIRLLDVDNQGTPFQSLIDQRLIDYVNNVPNGLFSTIGFNMYQYPESLLEEYFSAKLVEETLLNRWVDIDSCVGSNGVICDIASVEPRLRIEVAQFLERAIDDAINTCQGNAFLEASSYGEAVKREIMTIDSGNYQAPSKENYIYSLFDANSTQANYYSVISGYENSIRDSLVRAIEEYIGDLSTQYQNLQIVRFVLNRLLECMDDILRDWKEKYGLDGTPASWNIFWGNSLPKWFGSEWIYTITGSKYKFYTEVFQDIAKVCFFNVTIQKLEQIRDVISGGNEMSIRTTDRKHELPTINELDRVIAKVNALLDPHNAISLVSRKNSIGGQLSDTTNQQFNLLFVGGTYEEDCNSATARYNQQPNRMTFGRVSQIPLWNYLRSRNVAELRDDMISKGLSFVQGLNLFENVDVVHLMNLISNDPNHPLNRKVRNLFEATAEVIKQDLPPMVRLDQNQYAFANHGCLKLIVASPLVEDAENSVVANVNGYNLARAASNYVVLPSLKNTVVVYQEYAYMGNANGLDRTFNPLLNISYQSQVRASILQRMEQNAFNSSMRLAYIDDATLTDVEHVNIK